MPGLLLFLIQYGVISNIGVMMLTYVSNFTDVDDKIIKAANELGEEVGELTDRFIDAYFEDVGALGCGKADVHPRVTDHIEDIVEFVKVLDR